MTMDYEPRVNCIRNGYFTLLRADIFFPMTQQYFNGQRVAHDGRIIYDTVPRMSNSVWTKLPPRSEESSHGMHQQPADRLQQQFGQLPTKDGTHLF